ncbi:Kes1p protein [Uncinocarpus reesii 1704]|uniref:Kes1p protein n=1 Tax=Uncinocarpus reesii (strain UAMH 1704) TaxID=336963 RepID=C4JZ09_UNCRE|nr:Kes1p protein [Uncinocarpus reesii 1704]EEP82545.1 Kes1p protein [Uncinocarpus reesii 1704]
MPHRSSITLEYHRLGEGERVGHLAVNASPPPGAFSIHLSTFLSRLQRLASSALKNLKSHSRQAKMLHMSCSDVAAQTSKPPHLNASIADTPTPLNLPQELFWIDLFLEYHSPIDLLGRYSPLLPYFSASKHHVHLHRRGVCSPRRESRILVFFPQGKLNSCLLPAVSIASFNGDLSSLTAPPFILSGTSLVEYSAYWAEHPALFVAPAKEPDPAKRALLVLKWFLSTLHQQYATRSEKLGSEKKPLNPFLGELFLGKWDHEDAGETELFSEQVSHHPPVTAYSIENGKHGVELQGYNAQKASFSSTINVKQIGHAIYSLPTPNTSAAERETYLITLPSLHIESLIYGTPFVELDRSSQIVSSTGYIAKIDYSGKGWLSGKKNTFSAILYHESEGETNPIYTANGQWSKEFVLKEARGKKLEIEKYNVKTMTTTPLSLAKLEDQDIYESRRAWRDVAEAIDRGDMDATSVAKTKIENAQRELRKIERDEGREWERRFFRRVEIEEDKVFTKLLGMLGVTGPAGVAIESDKTNGVWRFDPDLAKNAAPPYHTDGGRGLGLALEPSVE